MVLSIGCAWVQHWPCQCSSSWSEQWGNRQKQMWTPGNLLIRSKYSWNMKARKPWLVFRQRVSKTWCVVSMAFLIIIRQDYQKRKWQWFCEGLQENHEASTYLHVCLWVCVCVRVNVCVCVLPTSDTIRLLPFPFQWKLFLFEGRLIHSYNLPSQSMIFATDNPYWLTLDRSKATNQKRPATKHDKHTRINHVQYQTVSLVTV